MQTETEADVESEIENEIEIENEKFHLIRDIFPYTIHVTKSEQRDNPENKNENKSENKIRK